MVVGYITNHILWIVQVEGKRYSGLELLLDYNLGFGLLNVESG
jgi:hypothetical protein